ncbi:MAG: M23 family metallopeptidase [Treponema sp.]|nr:M23 family metallopeptidase [Candidatus Treponema equifaecale]
MKKIFTLILLLSSINLFAAEKITRQFQNYSATIRYLSENVPGDAVFARITLETKEARLIKKISPKFKNEDFTASGRLYLYKTGENESEDKKITSTSMYIAENTGTKKNHNITLLAGIPLSTWIKPGEYHAVAEFECYGMQKEEIRLPIKINQKEFVSETIPLNESNTAIRTDNSEKRASQIKKLNEILDTKNTDAVYGTEAYQQPHPATRRTSFFGDRRVFAYSNGKSSTSLHYGIDFGVPTGNEVRACGSGKIVMAEDRITTGWSVVIEHLPGLYSLYYHNSELKCKVGDMVKKGDLIAISGATGLATGPHVHWEMRLNMEAVNPDFFKTDFTFKEEK